MKNKDTVLASKPYVSYRYHNGAYGYIAIGAFDHQGALKEAERSLSGGKANIENLEVWDSKKFVKVKTLVDATSKVITEMEKYGWVKANDDVAHVVIAKLEVTTFKGKDFADLNKIMQFENGTFYVKANFVSKGENVLAGCSMYISESLDDIETVAKAFNEELVSRLNDAFSVRMANQ